LGQFALMLTTCPGSPSTCEIFGVDDATQQQGAPLNVFLVFPVTDAGGIAACGSSSLEYIDYNIDGTNYGLVSTNPADSIMSYTIDSISSVATGIMGHNYVNSNHISFQFSSTGVAGTYPITSLSVQSLGNNNAAYLILPFNVTVTNFPANSSGFYEGNFMGQYKDSLSATTVHNISCSFRVRR
jgi:hypothetical protein